MVTEIEEEEAEDISNTNTNTEVMECEAANRKERRKVTKKEKRKKKRKELAEIARREEEARLNDPTELLQLQAEEEREKERIEKERREFEERERRILEEWGIRRALEEEDERRRRAQQDKDQSKGNQVGNENKVDEDGWEYVEEGSPEIIWQGNEIIVKKKRVRVKKKETQEQIMIEDPNRPTSNPLPPQSEAFADYKNGYTPSAQQLLENVAQQTPNFGTEQDKAHCPFHLKTGACRFGQHCSRIHFYPDKSCTLLIKNMYNGPGLAWEQDEGLEHTDEEIERAYEEFYEDVHTEFLKFGEIVNFKVCRNGSSHLRGNVYVNYKSLDSAVLAYQSVNGRYFAGKQIQCEYVGVTRWKVAICGEFMKSKLTSCSRGMTCNFIHCFRNPSGDYEWSDWDKPPPRYWIQKMVALFSCSDESANDKHIERENPRLVKDSSIISRNNADRYHAQRSELRETDYSRSSRNYSEGNTRSSSTHGHRHRSADRKWEEVYEDHDDLSSRSKKRRRRMNNKSSDSDSSDRDFSEMDICKYKRSGSGKSESQRFQSEGDRKIFDRRGYTTRWDGEIGYDNEETSNNSGRSHKTSSSSRKDTNKLESEKDSDYNYKWKKSKRKRDIETKFECSESRSRSREGKRSRSRATVTDYDRFDEDDDSERRGRWEPGIVVSEH